MIARFLGELRSDSSIGAIRVLALRFAGAALAFVSTIVITRLFGAATAGVYFIALAIVSAAATLSRLGLDLPTMRMVSVAGGADETPGAREVLRAASLMAASASAIVAVAIFVGATSLSRLFGEPALVPMIRAASLGIVPAAVSALYARALTGDGRPAIAEFGERAGFQIAFILFTIGLMGAFGDTALGASYTGGHLLMLALLMGVWASLAHQSRSRRLATRPGPTTELLRSGVPLLLAGAISLIIAWSDTLMVGYFLESRDVGIYGAASRTAAVVSFVLLAAGAVSAPRFAAYFSSGNLDALQHLYRRTSRWSGVAAMVIALPLIALAPYVLSMFGEGFSEGTTALRILASAQVVNSAVGLVAILLVMVKREKRVLCSTSLAALLNIALNAMLIPRWGISGAAISTAISIVAMNAANAMWVYRDLGMSILGTGSSRNTPELKE